MFWSELTWEEIPQCLKAVNYAAILPVGATEQHGPHLGCGVDSVIADIVCKEVSKNTKIPMLPTLPYGCSIGHSKHWSGTIAIQPITLIEFVKQIGDWAYASGVRRLFIVNAHVTNAAPLRCALEMLRASYDDLMVSIIHTASISQRVKEFHFADADDWHANDAETSIIMSQTPELFRAEKLSIADDPDRTEDLVFSHPVNHTSLNGTTGYPSRASIEKGQQWFNWMVEDLSSLLLKGIHEQPPLDTPYCSH
jgi:creatinine amidohydrolase